MNEKELNQLAVTSTPMSQYNKSNPLVILSKKQYSEIMDSIQAMSKRFISNSIFMACILGVFLIVEVLYGILAHITYLKGLELGIIFIILCCIGFGYFLRFRSLTDRFLHQHEAMQEFDRISNLELNDILMIGNEEVLICLHKMYELSGEIRIERKYFDLGGNLIILIYTFTLCAFIPVSRIISLIFGGA